ncbi:hypothetical protein Sjap_008871 [Stephania japonica]|uniref:Pentatricopeptide repeat-containing protein n=1 Tax=Stephania japonica TaxID=461633 RepID=A0AAP0PBS8_9MAGN
MNFHARLLKLGLITNPIFATRLLNSYAESQSQHSLPHAHKLFDEIPQRDTTLWNSIISAYSRAGHPHTALHLFSQMLSSHTTHFHVHPNHFVYATVARACGLTTHYFQLGRTVHGRVIKTGYLLNVVVGTSLLDMYAKYGCMEGASEVFDEMPERNLVSWNAMIAGYVLNGMEIRGMELFYLMKCVEFQKPDEFACASVLGASAGIGDLELGMQVHGYVTVAGFETDCISAVCSMYCRLGEVAFAEKIFEGEGESSIVRHIMIKGYILNERYYDALKLVAQNNFVDIVTADRSVIVSVLTACADLSLIRIGKQVHALIITLFGYLENFKEMEDILTVIRSALINMYCKCSIMSDARKVFESLVSDRHVAHWNSLITGYIDNGLLEDAIACFEEMPEKNVVSWTLMISGYVQHGLPHEGIRQLANMYNNGNGHAVHGNCHTFATAIEACSLLTVLEMGKQIHGKLIRTISNAETENVVVGTVLVNMYVKCGSLNYAEMVFARMAERNVVSWTSMITGYAIHGKGYRVLEVFEKMIETRIEPNEVTFISVLASCSHSGLVEEGLQYFKLMTDKYGLVPQVDHYSCLIDLLGRAGRLCEAKGLLEIIENKKLNELNTDAMSGAFLGACRLHGNIEMGAKVAENMVEKKQQFSDSLIALRNIYTSVGMWEEAYRVGERWRQTPGVSKSGKSSIFVQLGSSMLQREA